MYRFYCSCDQWPRHDVHRKGGLVDLIDAAQFITRRTFLKHISHEQLQEKAVELGYALHPSQGLTMAGDWHIQYFHSVLHGQRVYGFVWSAIEFVFTQENTP